MLIDDYLVHQINFEKKYGPNTIVLMQVGSFFECYGVNNEHEKIGDLQTITELLNIQLTRRNKAILENSRTNCLMAGFPTISLKRFINILLNSNYTVILIEQVTEPPNPKREITQIFSPGTYIEEINQSDSNNIVSLYITEENCYKTGKSIFSFGLSSIDLSTGYNTVYEGNNIYYEKNAFFEEIYRFIESNNPKEMIITWKNLNKIKVDDIRSRMNNIGNRIIHFNENPSNTFFNIHYQNSFLKKIFTNCSIYSPVEYIDLEWKQNALISYVILLQFSYEHNEKVIEKIQKPNHWEYDDHLILYNNVIYQLNIVPIGNMPKIGNHGNNKKYDSLFSIIEHTSTNMGKRLLKYRLINPITSVIELNKRYDMVDLFYHSDKIQEIHKILNEIIDIERLHRKMSLQLLHPHEFLSLSFSYENINKIIQLIVGNFDISLFNISNETFGCFQKYIQKYERLFNMREIGKYGLLNIDNSFFQKGNFKELDIIQEEIDNIQSFFNEECIYLSNIIEPGSDYVKLEHNEREGYFLYATKKRSDILIAKLDNEMKKKYEIKKYNGANIKIMSVELNQKSEKLVELKENIKILTKEQYLKTLMMLDEEYMSMLTEITSFIALIDIIKCTVLCAKKYKYCKPTIQNKNNDKRCMDSYFLAKDIRHPIIEMINDTSDYVKNDLELVHEKCNGLLLYGVNGSGKSSLSKAVGCNILLAQIGFYVPCSEFIYYPYKKIFTRINGDDNIFKGMSSFAVEMDELRSILKYSDNRSIVLGDEICKGTEETSALSIVSASILRFVQKNVNFIMATHFHKLNELEEIQKIKNIKSMHLSISYDIENGNIIYGRKLEEGCGSNLYGIEIANYIIEDNDFIQNAKQIRNKLLNKTENLLEKKTSNYNSKLYMDGCSICGKNGIQYPLDTHHIKEQNTFDEDDINKDKLANLVVLCKQHHDEVHHGNLKINGYIDTLQGMKLDYYYIENLNQMDYVDQINQKIDFNTIELNFVDKVNNKKKDIKEDIDIKKKRKYNHQQIKLIKDLSIELKDQKQYMKILLNELKKHNINTSAKTIDKIIKDNY
jgi:DNA mismatch repair protein MutS